jgi:hypothetical protein
MLTGFVIIALFAVFFAGWYHISIDRLRPYRDVLNPEKANLVYAADYGRIKDIILPARKSIFSRSEPVIWLYREDYTELFLTANYKNDVRIWFQPKTVLKGVHIVLDSKENNSSNSNLISKKLPKQEVNLEGDFSRHFKLFCNENQQIIALQVIAPDVMAYLIDNLLNVDIEIIDNQIALISRRVAKNQNKLEATIKTATKIDKLVRAATKVTKL